MPTKELSKVNYNGQEYVIVDSTADSKYSALGHHHTVNDIDDFHDTTYTFNSPLSQDANHAVSLGTVPVGKGGTGATTFTSGQVLIGNGSNAIGTRAIDTTNGGTASSNSLITSGAVYSGLSGKADSGHHHSVSELTDHYYNTFASPLSENSSTHEVSLSTVGVSKGGTGATSFTANSVIMSGNTTTAAFTTRAIDTTNGGTNNSTSLITSGAVYSGLSGKSDVGHHHSYTDINDIGDIFAANDAMVFKGTLGTSGDGGTIQSLPNTHSAGETYRVVTAGTYAGKVCEIGDLIICVKDGSAANNNDWTVAQSNLDGAVIGPASATADNIATYNATTGKLIKDSGYAITTSISESTKTTTVPSSGAVIDYLGGYAVAGHNHDDRYIQKSTLSGAYDVMYSSAANTPARLAANTTSTLKTLTMKGTGSAGAAPAWSDVSTLINSLGEGTSPAQRNDYIVAQYAGGGTSTTSYHRRKLSNIFKALNSDDVTDALGFTPATNDHGHGDITNDGKIGSAANKALYTTTNGVITAATLPIAAGGTGATSAADAWTALGGGASGKHADNYYALSGHTHTTSLAADNGTATTTLAYGQTYKLTAGGTNTIFEMPDGYTHPTGTQANAAAVKVGSDSLGHVVIGSALTASDVGAATSGHTHTTSLAADNGTATTTLAFGQTYKLTAGGTNTIFEMPAAPQAYTHPAGTQTAAAAVKVGSDALGHVVLGAALTAADVGAATSGHTHTLTLAADNGTATVSLAHGQTYKLTAGGKNLIFEMPTGYTHPTTSGNKHIPSGGSSGQFLGWSADGTAAWVANPNTNYYHKTGSWSGLTYTAAKVGSPDDLAFTIPTGTTSTTVAAGDHTHTTSLTSGGTATVNLAANTTYTLTAGGTSVIFKTPADGNTDTKVNVISRGTTKTYLLGDTTAPTGTAAAHTAVAETGIYMTTTAGELNATQYKVNEAVTMQYNSTTKSLDFIFA